MFFSKRSFQLRNPHLVLRILDQVFDIIEITLVVVKFLGNPRTEKAPSHFVRLAVTMMLLPGRRRGSFPKIGQVLPRWSEWHVIFVIGKALIAHQADVIETLVGPLTKSQMMLRLGFHAFT